MFGFTVKETITHFGGEGDREPEESDRDRQNGDRRP